MKKIIALLLIMIPLIATAQSTLTPQEQLEQAQKQLAEAQKALEAAKQNAEKAKAEAKAKADAAELAKKKADEEARAKAEEIQKQIEKTKAETARLQEEASKANSEAVTAENEVATKAQKKIVTRLSKDDDEEDESKQAQNAKYLSADAVPVVNGYVEWENTIKVPGKSADELYDLAEKYLTQLTSDKQQLQGSQVAIHDKAKHNIVATVHEWLVFKNSALSLDRAEFYYVLDVTCGNGQVEIKMNRIRYTYDVQGKVDHYKAEKWITDKEAVNKKRTRLYPISGKFRRKTIDRKDEIFETLKETLLQ